MTTPLKDRIKFISKITVECNAVLADDVSVVHAARVSTKGQMADGAAEISKQEAAGVIRYLMEHRHGTPFEHNFFRFFVHAPICVWREWHRHRIGFSYNEESGRYKQLDPVFYVPNLDRPMFKVDLWRAGRPKFTKAVSLQEESSFLQLNANLKESYMLSYENYEKNLALGVDPGLARDCLPVGIYSSCWVTCNARSLMAFLSLRTHELTAAKVSYPLYEIEAAARQVEKVFAQAMPLTHQAFLDFGRQDP